MKADTHPDYHAITVVMTDGTAYETRSTYGRAGATIKLDVDPLTHPAWQGGGARVVERGQMDKFTRRFGAFVASSKQDDNKSA